MDAVKARSGLMRRARPLRGKAGGGLGGLALRMRMRSSREVRRSCTRALDVPERARASTHTCSARPRCGRAGSSEPSARMRAEQPSAGLALHQPSSHETRRCAARGRGRGRGGPVHLVSPHTDTSMNTKRRMVIDVSSECMRHLVSRDAGACVHRSFGPRL